MDRDLKWWWWPVGLAAVFGALAFISFRNPSHNSPDDVEALQRADLCHATADGRLLRTGSDNPCRPSEHGFGVVVLAVAGGAVLGLGVSGAVHAGGRRASGRTVDVEGDAGRPD